MYLYHRTHHATPILRNGFKDGRGCYLTSEYHRGVWFSNMPLDINEGAKGTDLLRVSILAALIKDYEWVEAGKKYREFLVHAKIVYRYHVKKVCPYINAMAENPVMPYLIFLNFN